MMTSNPLTQSLAVGPPSYNSYTTQPPQHRPLQPSLRQQYQPPQQLQQAPVFPQFMHPGNPFDHTVSASALGNRPAYHAIQLDISRGLPHDGLSVIRLLQESEITHRQYYDDREASLKAEFAQLEVQFATREASLKTAFATREAQLEEKFAAREATLKAEFAEREKEMQQKIQCLTGWIDECMPALTTGAAASIRAEIERFADKFQFEHGKGKRALDISGLSTTSVLEHYTECRNSKTSELLGVKLTRAVQRLSDIIHNSLVLVDGKFVLPAALTSANKRFVIRFLQAKGEEVLIGQMNGRPRERSVVSQIGEEALARFG